MATVFATDLGDPGPGVLELVCIAAASRIAHQAVQAHVDGRGILALGAHSLHLVATVFITGFGKVAQVHACLHPNRMFSI